MQNEYISMIQSAQSKNLTESPFDLIQYLTYLNTVELHNDYNQFYAK